MTVSDWIALGGIAVVIAGALFKHIISDIRHQSSLESRMERIERDIGTHESGLRGQVHEHGNMLSRLRAVVYFIGRKLGIEVMKDLDDDK